MITTDRTQYTRVSANEIAPYKDFDWFQYEAYCGEDWTTWFIPTYRIEQINQDLPVSYRVLTPDGFDIRRETIYDTPEQAEEDLTQWVKGYEAQGYYSWRGNRLSLEELKANCKILKSFLLHD
jgi:hypothetical protein